MTDAAYECDKRIPEYIAAAQQLKQGYYQIDFPSSDPDEIGQLGEALKDLAANLDAHFREAQKLSQITSYVNLGLLLDEVLEGIYNEFQSFIPYNRIGLSLIEDGGTTARAYWAKSDQPELKLGKGHSASLEGSSLQTILLTGKPRIINDLEAYARAHSRSESTRLMLAEGIRSSLTCPLIANGAPIGFLFFSSRQPHTYDSIHIDIFEKLAGQISIMVEKGRLVSEIVAHKATIEQRNAELQRLNEIKNEFLGMVAHDLRNPISNIQLGTFLLQNDPTLPQETRDVIVNEISHQSSFMLSLLNELLDISEIEAGQFNLQRMVTDVRDFLYEIVDRHAQLAASTKGTQVVVDCVDDGTLLIDPLRLRQVIDNFITNAVKFSPAGSTVWICAYRTEDGWRFDVRDQGPGLTDEDRAQLFQDFARLSARPTGDEKSTGLGLAISRRVVEAHGGQIGADSEPGRGATFWFTLPSP